MKVLASENGGVFFSLNNSFDLYRKCVFDLNACQLAMTDQAKIYSLFNLAIGISHLYEWVLKDREIKPEMKDECRRRFLPHKKSPTGRTRKKLPPEMLQENPNQSLLLDVCNGLKHMNNAPTTERKTAMMELGCGGEDARCGNYYNRCGAESEPILSMFFVDDKDFEPLCAQLVEEWGNFFYEATGRRA